MRLTECNNVSVPFLREIWIVFVNIKHSDQVPEAISRLPAVDDTSDSFLDSAWVFFLYQCKCFLIRFHYSDEHDFFWNCFSKKIFPSFYIINQSNQEKKPETILLWVYLCHFKKVWRTFFFQKVLTIEIKIVHRY